MTSRPRDRRDDSGARGYLSNARVVPVGNIDVALCIDVDVIRSIELSGSRLFAIAVVASCSGAGDTGKNALLSQSLADKEKYNDEYGQSIHVSHSPSFVV